MAERKLDAIVLTEHDAQWGREELESLRRACHPRHIFSGIELSARDGHVVALGMTGGMPIDKRRSVEETVRMIAESGGTSILVHPFRSKAAWGMTPPPELGAVEIASTVTVGETAEASAALAALWRLPGVAGSDAHALDRVGYCWTWLPDLPRDELELGRQLRAGIGVASPLAREGLG